MCNAHKAFKRHFRNMQSKGKATGRWNMRNKVLRPTPTQQDIAEAGHSKGKPSADHPPERVSDVAPGEVWESDGVPLDMLVCSPFYAQENEE
jgi:hypothetical protein